jgi:hypothetical protein
MAPAADGSTAGSNDDSLEVHAELGGVAGWLCLYALAMAANAVVIAQWPITSIVSANTAVYLFGVRDLAVLWGWPAGVGVGAYAAVNLGAIAVCDVLIRRRRMVSARVLLGLWLLSILPIIQR